MKTALRLITLVSVFLLSWLLLAQVNWMEHLGIRQLSESTEEQLSDFVKEQIERTEDVIKTDEVVKTIDSLIHIISKANGFESSEIKIMVVNNQQINAFALPTNYMVINTGLIDACESPEALCGVIAHELSHIKLNHVKKKLLKELGVAVLVSSTSGGGGEVVRQVTKTLSSTAYDRSLEKEADENAVQYLINAQIDPEPLAAFFYQLSLREPDFLANLEWINTHESSKERSKNILNLIEGKDLQKRPVIHPATWTNLQRQVNEFNIAK